MGDGDQATFRHLTPDDGDLVPIPDHVQFENIHFEVDADGQAHLLWLEVDDTRVI